MIQLIPERVDSLIIVNALTTAAGWFEWGNQVNSALHSFI
jgi:hypothetical protein